MNKHAKQLYDWNPPPPGKDEGEAVRKVAAEIERNVPGYEPPVPVSREERKDMTKSARRREREREAEHQERIEALERAEKQLRDDHKNVASLHRRLKQLADDQVEEQRRGQQKQRARESAEHLQATLAEGNRRTAAAAEARHAHVRQTQQMRDEYVQGLQNIIDGWNRANNPPPAPQIVYVETEEETGGGRLPRLPTWR
jgi:DNA repair exonuclease SbcCD ATPase subunit